MSHCWEVYTAACIVSRECLTAVFTWAPHELLDKVMWGLKAVITWQLIVYQILIFCIEFLWQLVAPLTGSYRRLGYWSALTCSENFEQMNLPCSSFLFKLLMRLISRWAQNWVISANYIQIFIAAGTQWRKAHTNYAHTNQELAWWCFQLCIFFPKRLKYFKFLYRIAKSMLMPIADGNCNEMGQGITSITSLLSLSAKILPLDVEWSAVSKCTNPEYRPRFISWQR